MKLEFLIKEKLRDYDFRIISGSHTDASVLILLTEEATTKIYFVRRSTRVALHPGEISLPGGILNKYDRSLIDTAYRETYEEIGVSKNSIRFLGRMGHHMSSSGIRITPFIGIVNQQVVPIVKSNEIDEVIVVPVHDLINQTYIDPPLVKVDGKEVSEYFIYNEKIIWGVTGRIVCEFFNKCFAKSYPVHSTPDLSKA